MRGKTHLAAGVAVGLLFAQHNTAAVTPYPVVDDAVITLASAAMSLFPDLDIHTSKAGRKFPILSRLTQLLFGHRKMLHAPLFYLTIAYLLYLRWPQFSLFIFSAFLGAASHLFLDALNPQGVPLIWPDNKRFRLAHIRSGSVTDRVIGWLFLATDIFLFLQFFNF